MQKRAGTVPWRMWHLHGSRWLGKGKQRSPRKYTEMGPGYRCGRASRLVWMEEIWKNKVANRLEKATPGKQGSCLMRLLLWGFSIYLEWCLNPTNRDSWSIYQEILHLWRAWWCWWQRWWWPWWWDDRSDGRGRGYSVGKVDFWKEHRKSTLFYTLLVKIYLNSS